MNNKDKKIVDEQEKLFDHLIEYGGRQYMHDEIKKYEDLPELEPSKEFDDKMHRMFKDAYKNEVRHERIRFGKKIAVIAIATVGIISAAAMNIKAVREPVLNFVFNENGTTNKTRLSKKQTSNSKFAFRYIPKDYQLKLKQISSKQIIYTYSDKQKNPIYIKIQSNTAYDDYINQSNSDHYQELSVNGKKYYFLSGDQNSLIMYKRNHVFSIISSLPKSELLKIATNIKIIRNRK